MTREQLVEGRNTTPETFLNQFSNDLLQAFEMTPERPVEWRTDATPVAYPEALAFMDVRVAEIHAGEAAEVGWLLE